MLLTNILLFLLKHILYCNHRIDKKHLPSLDLKQVASSPKRERLTETDFQKMMYAKQSHSADTNKNISSKYNNSYEDEESDQLDDDDDHHMTSTTKANVPQMTHNNNKQPRKQQEPRSELPEDEEEALYDEEEDEEERAPVDDTYDEIDRPLMSNEEKFEDDNTNDIHSSHDQEFGSTTPVKSTAQNAANMILTPPLTQSDLLCTTCNKQFDNLHRLQRHMMCHDMNPELRKFKCDFCNKAFKFKHHLKVGYILYNFITHQSDCEISADNPRSNDVFLLSIRNDKTPPPIFLFLSENLFV